MLLPISKGIGDHSAKPLCPPINISQYACLLVEAVLNQFLQSVECLALIGTVRHQRDRHTVDDTEGQNAEQTLCIDAAVILLDPNRTLVGIGFMSKALVIFIAAMVAMIVNSYSGIKQTKAVHLWVGQTFGANNFELLTRVAIPSALPMIFTGLDVAMGAAWTTLVAAELLASTSGLGFMMQQARGIFRLDIVMVGMVTIAISGYILSLIIEKLDSVLVRGGSRR